MASAGPLVGILLCAHLDRALQPLAGGDYDTVYDHFLRAGDPTVRTRAYDAINGELPSSTLECDAWLLTGSPHDAFEDIPWIVALRDFVTHAVADGARIVGVCFGHQLVATALGGTVARADGFAVGPHTMRVETTDWFPGGDVTINAMHRDVVTRLPARARPIASGSTAAVPAFVVGDSVLCIQDHPEFGPDLTAALIRSRRDLIDDTTASVALQRLAAVATNGDLVARWIVDFLLDRRG